MLSSNCFHSFRTLGHLESGLRQGALPSGHRKHHQNGRLWKQHRSSELEFLEVCMNLSTCLFNSTVTHLFWLGSLFLGETFVKCRCANSVLCLSADLRTLRFFLWTVFAEPCLEVAPSSGDLPDVGKAKRLQILEPIQLEHRITQISFHF